MKTRKTRGYEPFNNGNHSKDAVVESESTARMIDVAPQEHDD